MSVLLINKPFFETRIRERLCLPHLPAGSGLKEVQVRPYYGKFMLVLVLEKAESSLRSDLPHMAGIDLGTDNIADNTGTTVKH